MHTNEKKLAIILVITSAIIFFIFGASSLVINKVADKAADKVMQRLQREYVPGPYNPGFDPDKIEPKKPPN